MTRWTCGAAGRWPTSTSCGSTRRRWPAHRRIAAARDCADRALAAGDARTALDRLRRVAQDEPLNEGVSARIMLALAATGERAAALRLYRDVREQLVESLGIEPGPELADAHLAILRQRPKEPAVPRQLPRDIASFTGRERQLAALDALLDTGAATPIAVISGPRASGRRRWRCGGRTGCGTGSRTGSSSWTCAAARRATRSGRCCGRWACPPPGCRTTSRRRWRCSGRRRPGCGCCCSSTARPAPTRCGRSSRRARGARWW
ncbi:BTAD domain-containing putative transcriptional regulator [Actinokineospora soli]|uniref:BTAD domain-containing putative transcriptional regulator n=1 Tax=Actinokineospora soli TaxID=1048753 RepID=A0ABW2TPL0_9PSEU